MKGVVLIVLGVSSFVFGLHKPANISISKGGSLLIKWHNSDVSREWFLFNEKGTLCSKGKAEKYLFLPKVATDADLIIKGEDNEKLVIKTPRKLTKFSKINSNVVIYELPVRTYLAKGAHEENTGKLSYLTIEVLKEIKELGVDYIWIAGILENANPKIVDPDVVKGDAGSFYAIYDNWDISSQVGNLDEFDALIERAHSIGLRVLIDFIPNHTARVHKTDVVCKEEIDFGKGENPNENFSLDNNFYYLGSNSTFVPPKTSLPGVDGFFDMDIFMPGIQFESPARVTGNNVLSALPQYHDWYETVKLNYGLNLFSDGKPFIGASKTWKQMLDVAIYWLNKGVDGFRVDVTHGVAVEFWYYFINEVRKVQPNAFFVAEAFEEDPIKSTGFSLEKLFDAGFDSVLNGPMYWNLRRQALLSQNMNSSTYYHSPGSRKSILDNGYSFTHYMGNHDEVRLASSFFAPSLESRVDRAWLGLAYSIYAALLPGNFLIHGGDEFQEEASLPGVFGGYDGRTSIFDFVYQPQTRTWLYEERPHWMINFREMYRRLFSLKKRIPFNIKHSTSNPTFIDLMKINDSKNISKWVSAYVRFFNNERYLVVMNADPHNSHEVTIHFTSRRFTDSLEVLSALNIKNDETRYVFTEVMVNPGFVPTDPNISGYGIPGRVLHKAGGIPSGLYLGWMWSRTTYVFKISEID